MVTAQVRLFERAQRSALSKTSSKGNRFSMLLCTQWLPLGRRCSVETVGCCILCQSLIPTLCTLPGGEGSEEEAGKTLQLLLSLFLPLHSSLNPVSSSPATTLVSPAQFQLERNSSSELGLENTTAEEYGLGTVLGRGG